MKTKEEFVNKYLSDLPRKGVKDIITKEDALRMLDDFSSQSLSSKIEEVREKVKEDFMFEETFGKHEKSTWGEGAKWMRDLIFTSLEGEKG